MKINKLRQNIVKYFILAVFLIMSLICIIIIFLSFAATKNAINSNLDGVYKEMSSSGEDIALRLPKSYYFKLDSDNNIIKFATDGSFLEEKKVYEMLSEVLKGNEEVLSNNIYYKVYIEGEYKVYVFVDATSEMTAFNNTVFISTITCISSFILISSFSFLISKWVVKPYEESYENEKKFLTNASHELKTPLTIISSNNELIVKEYGNNEYSSSISNQINRMIKLINEMISLNKINETYIKKAEFVEFSLTELLYEAITPYINFFKEKEINYKLNIEENITYKGSEENIFKLFSLLLDNITKYIGGRKEVEISLTKNKSKIKVIFLNSVDEIDENKLNEIFNRFYTIEESHNSSKTGFGIGLSLAKEIVSLHKGDIVAKTNETNDFVIEIDL